MTYSEKDYLAHYGVPGMRWGHRKAQPFSMGATRHRMAAKVFGINERAYRKSNPTLASMNKSAKNKQLKAAERAQQAANAKAQAKVQYKQTAEYKAKSAKRAKALKTGAAVAGTALAVYGAYKVSKYVKDTNASIAGKKAYEQAEKRFQNETVSGLYKRAKLMQEGGAVKGMVQETAFSGNRARNAYMDTRNRTSTAQAAKNVLDYRRKNGRKSLRNARSTYNTIKNNRGSSFRVEW
jgi:hypothetical protein